MMRLRAGPTLTLAGLAAIALATLGPMPPSARVAQLPFLCLRCGEYGSVDFLLNIALFVPLGIGLRLSGRSFRTGTLIALALTIAIESLQATVIPGRDAAIGDIIANTLGGILGLMVSTWWPPVARPSRRAALGLLVGISGVSVALPAVAVLLFRPSPAPTPTWWGQHAHEFGGMSQFGGRIVSVSLNDIPVSDGVLPGQALFKDSFRQTEVRFAAVAITGPIPPHQAQVAAIADGTGGWVAAIWQDGPDAIASIRLGSADWLLRAPIIRIPGAFAWPPGSRVAIMITASSMALSATVRPPEGTLQVSLPLTTTRAWNMLWPWSTTFSRDPILITAAWLIGWVGLTTGLLFWWGRAAARPRLGAFLAIASLLATLWAAPLATGTPAAKWWEWGCAVAGLGLGALPLRFRPGTDPASAPGRPDPA